MNKTSFEELKLTGNLPSPSGVALEVLRLTRSEDFSHQELAETLQSDPALTGRILQVANSPLAGAGAPVADVGEATVRLGTGTVRSIALGFSLVSSYRSGQCEFFDFTRFWSESLARSLTAQALARTLKTGSPNEAFVCGLLSDVGHLALATVHSASYSELLKASGDDRALRRKRETEEYGIHAREISQLLMEEWGLPSKCQSAIHQLDADLDPAGVQKMGLGEVLWMSRRFAIAFWQASSTPVDDDQVQALLARSPHWDASKMPLLWNHLVEEWQRWGKTLGTQTHSLPSYGTKPVEAATEAVPASAEEIPHDLTPEIMEEEGDLRILVVDDEETSALALTRQLKQEGFDVQVCIGGEEGLRMTLEWRPDLVVADWMMPEFDGLDLCRALRKFPQGNGIYFILSTHREDSEGMLEAFDAGIDDYVTKSFSTELLFARVRAGERVIRLQRRIKKDHAIMRKQVAQLGILNRKLKRASLTDPLTQLPNRRHAMEALETFWDKASREGVPFALSIADIDHFKSFNDTYGHDIGDLVLKTVADSLKNAAEEEELVARLGGEEFVILHGGTDSDHALLRAEAFRKSVEATTVEHAGSNLAVTISVGMAEYARDRQDAEELLKVADEALYEAKEHGRNQVWAAPMPTASTT